MIDFQNIEAIEALAAELEKCLEESKVLLNEPMKSHTTFKAGGCAAIFIEAKSIDDVIASVVFAKKHEIMYYILGRGSNVLVADSGIFGIVIHLGKDVSDIKQEGTKIIAQAGALNKQVAQVALDADLTGFEFAHGIPGTIGGAAVMNAGAYGGEFANVCTKVTCYDPGANKIVELTQKEAAWGYRNSAIMRKGYVVLEVELELKAGLKEEIKSKMDELAQARRDKQPLDKPSAGSTFKRPEGYFAGKLIQDANMQGHSCADAQVSTKHAGFIVNNGNASATDIHQCINDVKKAVKDKFDVNLECEVRLWGF